MDDRPRCSWDHFIWEKLAVKKHQFIAWLAILEKAQDKRQVGEIYAAARCTLSTMWGPD